MAATLAQAAYNTIVYFDTRDTALTLLEIERWIFAYTPRYQPLHTLADALDADERIEQEGPWYFLRGRNNLVPLRNQQYNWAEAKWRHARPLLRLLAMVPYVEGIWLTNKMGWNTPNRLSDIDICIIAKRDHIWSVRFWTTALMKLLRQRPGEQHPAKAICLSMYATDDALRFKDYAMNDRDIPFMYWVNQMYPVYDSINHPRVYHFRDYAIENTWIDHELMEAKWSLPAPRRSIALSKPERALKWVMRIIAWERPLKWLQKKLFPKQIRAMANKDTRVILADHVLKLHTNDNRAEQWAHASARMDAME